VKVFSAGASPVDWMADFVQSCPGHLLFGCLPEEKALDFVEVQRHTTSTFAGQAEESQNPFF
jgi:hypothetical protein